MIDKASRHLMNESFEIKGVWYLPGQEMQGYGVLGILRYNPNEIRLELFELFKGEEDLFYSGETIQTPRKNIIYGFSNHGEWFTLYDCLTVDEKINAPGFSTVSYVVNRFYAGSQLFDNEDGNIIEKCDFSFTYLDAWLNIDIIERQVNKEISKYGYSIDLGKAKQQLKRTEVSSENLLIEEEIGCILYYPKDYYCDETIKTKLNRYYEISSMDGNSLSYINCRDALMKIKRLLTLIIGNPLYCLYIDLKLPSVKEKLFDGSEQIKAHKCRSFFKQAGDINKQQSISPHNRGSILIYRDHIKDNMDLIFDNWFYQQKLISEIVNPFISDLYLPSFLETKFLNVIRGIETYHRCFIMKKDEALMEPSALVLNEDRKRIKSFIQKEISESNRDYFIERIDYEDEESLYKRLKEVLNNIPEELMHKMFGELNSEKKDKVIQKVVQTRNYLTHRDNKEKYLLAIDDASVLDNYIEKLGVILQYLILKQIGVNSDIVVKRLLEFSKNSFAFNNN